MRERQQNRDTFRLHKHLLPRQFQYFHCSNFKMTLDKRFMKKADLF